MAQEHTCNSWWNSQRLYSATTHQCHVIKYCKKMRVKKEFLHLYLNFKEINEQILCWCKFFHQMKLWLNTAKTYESFPPEVLEDDKKKGNNINRMAIIWKKNKESRRQFYYSISASWKHEWKLWFCCISHCFNSRYDHRFLQKVQVETAEYFCAFSMDSYCKRK